MDEERTTPRPRAARREESAIARPVDEAEPPDDPRARRDPSSIRAEDTEPYLGLQYIARLFKIVALVVIVALAAEVVIGLSLEGPGAILPLVQEVVQLGVLAAILWGVSDLTLLFIDVGHDVRAARVLLGRLSARTAEPYDDEHPPFAQDGDDEP